MSDKFTTEITQLSFTKSDVVKVYQEENDKINVWGYSSGIGFLVAALITLPCLPFSISAALVGVATLSYVAYQELQEKERLENLTVSSAPPTTTCYINTILGSTTINPEPAYKLTPGPIVKQGPEAVRRYIAAKEKIAEETKKIAEETKKIESMRHTSTLEKTCEKISESLMNAWSSFSQSCSTFFSQANQWVYSNRLQDCKEDPTGEKKKIIQRGFVRL